MSHSLFTLKIEPDNQSQKLISSDILISTLNYKTAGLVLFFPIKTQI